MPYIILREYSGKGIFEFKVKEPFKDEANFKIYFFSNARIKLETSFSISKDLAKILGGHIKGLVDVSLNGIVGNEIEGDIGTISIEKMVIKSINITQKGENATIQLELLCSSIVDIIYSDVKSGVVEIHYGLTNFIFSGCVYSVEGKKFSLDKFCASVNNLKFMFKKVKDYGEMEARLKDKKGCQVTSEAIVDVLINDEDKARTTIFNIIELLSLATRNFISPIYEDYSCAGELMRTVLNPVITCDYNISGNLINSNSPNPCLLQIYLECTYDKYENLRDALCLNGIVHLYLSSRSAFFTEAKFLLAIASLESLLSNFEKYLETKGDHIKPSSVGRTKKTLTKELKIEGIKIEDQVIEKIASSIAYSHPTFDDKLAPLLKEFKVKQNPGDADLNYLRNKIVHNGKFPEKFNSRLIVPYEEDTRLVYLLDRIILSIIGYKNKQFLNIFNDYREEELL